MSDSVAYPPTPETSIQSPAAQGNPLAMVGQLAATQNAINQNRMFQAQFMAKSKLGEILAQAPDLESGLQAAFKDPTVSPWMGEFGTQVRQMQQFMIQNEGLRAGQANDAASAAYKMMPSIVADPAHAMDKLNLALSTLPPEMQKRPEIQATFRSLANAMVDGVPMQPEEGESQSAFLARQRLAVAKNGAAMGLGHGVEPGIFGAITGMPTATPTGNQVQFPITGANPLFASPSAPLGIGAAPGFGSPNEVPRPAIGAGGGIPTPSAGGRASPNPLLDPNPPAGYPNVNGLGGGGLGASPPALQRPALAPAPLAPAYDGKPLYQSVPSTLPELKGQGLGGMDVKNQTQEKADEAAMEHYNGPEKEAYSAANTNLLNIAAMKQAFAKLAQLQPVKQADGSVEWTPGFLAPGFGGEARGKFASLVNTIGTIIGDKSLSFDPNKVASSEMIDELANRMGTGLTQQMLGSQREAAETISRFTNAVPNLNNTYLGAMAKMETITAAAQYIKDQHEFNTQWLADSAHKGSSLVGADVAFSKQHPPEQYITRALGELGVTASGKFASLDAAKRAINMGLVTKDQAKAIGLDRGQ